MKTICFLLLLFTLPARAEDAAARANEEVLQKLPIGAKALTQNSFGGWDDQVVEVVQLIDDQSVRVRYKSGATPRVQFKNLKKNLSPSKECGTSHGEKICRGQKVIYPQASVSLRIPEGEITEIFENNRCVLRDGDDMHFNLEELGVAKECSPQKPSICTGVSVLGEDYHGGEKFTFEGKVEKTYSNGLVLVRSGSSLYQLQAEKVKKIIAAEASLPAVVTEQVAPKENTESLPAATSQPIDYSEDLSLPAGKTGGAE